MEEWNMEASFLNIQGQMRWSNVGAGLTEQKKKKRKKKILANEASDWVHFIYPVCYLRNAKAEKSEGDYFIESMTNLVYDAAVLLCVVLVIALETV